MEQRSPILVAQGPKMLIRTSTTKIAQLDPLNAGFQKLFEFIPSRGRDHFVAALGEFFGTLLFVFMVFAAAQVAFVTSNNTRKGNIDTSISEFTPQEILFVSLGAGFSLTVTAWTFFRVSGGLFNPVVSIGMGWIGALTWARVAILCVLQTVATIIAAYLVNALFPGGLNVGTTLHPQVSLAQGTIIEALLTAQLVFTILMLAAEQHTASFIAPIGIGFSFFIAEMIGLFWTGGSLNPVRSLAPAIVNGNFPSYHWIYWVGPMMGSVLAALIYKLIKALEYETAQCHGANQQPILPTSTKHQPDGFSGGEGQNLNGNPIAPSSSPPGIGPGSSQHLNVQPYAKSPSNHEKGSEDVPKQSMSQPSHDGEAAIDPEMFKVPSILRTDIEYLSARYTEKLNPTITRSNTSASPKIGPLKRTPTGYIVGQYSTPLKGADMDFQCKGLPMLTEEAPDIKPLTRTDTDFSAFYSAHSILSRISTDSTVKRQPRSRVSTDEISQASKRVSWNV